MSENRIRDMREDSDLTQTQLAGKIGLTQRKYSYIETGRHLLDAETIVALADFYGVTTDYLLKRTNDPRGLQTTCPCWEVGGDG